MPGTEVGQHGHPWMVLVDRFHGSDRNFVSDLVLDQRLGVDAPADRVADHRHLLSEIRLAQGSCGNLEAKPGFRRLFIGWIRARDAVALEREVVHTVRVIKVKEFGDVNVSTLMSLLMLAGLVLMARV